MRARAQVPSCLDARLLRLRFVRLADLPDEGNDLREVHDLATALVLRHVPHGQHSLRDLRQAAERELGVTYKTAWRIMNKIRNELMDGDDDEPLSGDVEIDETSWGGKPRVKLTPRRPLRLPRAQGDGARHGGARRAREAVA